MAMSRSERLPLDAPALRAEFPILQDRDDGQPPLVYLDNAATTQRPQQVIDRITTGYQQQYANVHRGIHRLSELSTDLFEQAREAVQRFIGARHSHEIIFTPGATGGINLVARSWGDSQLGPGDEILLTEMEHHSNIVPWQQLAQRTGCRLRFAPVTAEGLLDLSGWEDCLNERTRLVAVTAVSNVLGTINPVVTLVRRAHEAGAVVVIDAAQSVPHEPTDVLAWDADFVAFSGHKMLGPSGVGVLYGREELLEAMPPFLGGGSMIHRVTLDGFTPANLPSKFEAGTPPIVPAWGLAAAIEFLDRVGLPTIRAHERLLTEQTHALLNALSGVRILGPSPDQKAGIVSFVVPGIQANDLAMALDEQGVAVRAGHHCAMPLHARLGVSASVRASFYLYNTPDDVERLGQAMDCALKLFRRRH